MPELPEVEVTRRLLEPKVVGRRISHVSCGPPSYFFLTPPKRLERSLVGEPVTALERQGKYLLIGLGEGRRHHADGCPALARREAVGGSRPREGLRPASPQGVGCGHRQGT